MRNVVWSTVDLLVRAAGRRWPEALRDERTREWAAEVHALRSDPTLGTVARAVQQLRFALSLAWSPPVEDQNGVPSGWREILPGLGRGLQPILALLGGTVLCALLAGGISFGGRTVLFLIRGYPVGMGPLPDTGRIDWAANTVSVSCLVAAALLTWFAGGWLGRRVPMIGGQVGAAVLAPVILAGGLYGLDAATSSNFDDRGGTVSGAPTLWLGLLTWLLLVIPVATVAVRSACRGQRGRAALVAVLGGLATLELTAIATAARAANELHLDLMTAPLWFPLSLLEPYDSGITLGAGEQGYADWETVIASATFAVRSLLCGTAFVLAYALRTRALEPATAQVSIARSALDAPVRGPRRFAAGAMVVALGVWAYTVAVLTPAVVPLDNTANFSGELHIWVHEQRGAAILLAVLGLILAGAGRGPVLLPAVFAGAALLVVDSVIDRTDAGGPAVLVAMIALGAAILGGGWLLNGGLGRAAPNPIAARRALVGVAVTAGFCAPALFTHAIWSEHGHLLPPGLRIAATAVVSGLAALGVVAAQSARPMPAPRAARILFPVAAALALGALAAYLPTGGPWLPLLGGAGLLLVLLLIPAARKVRLGWRTVLVVVGTLVLTVPLLYGQLIIALMVGSPLMAAAGYTFPADGLPFLPGSVIAALPIATLIAVRLVPSTGSSIVDEPTYLPAASARRQPPGEDHPLGPVVA